jgi:hypothetical protein
MVDVAFNISLHLARTHSKLPELQNIEAHSIVYQFRLRCGISYPREGCHSEVKQGSGSGPYVPMLVWQGWRLRGVRMSWKTTW